MSSKEEYQKAYNADGTIIDISTVTKESRLTDLYKCIGCGREMIACLGEKNRHYFRHKEKCECNGMTYIHRLVEETYYNEIKKRIENKERLVVTLQRKCKHDVDSVCGNYLEFDFLKYFDEVEFETRDEKTNLIPDIKLVNKKTGDVVFIEIANTHFCDDKKIETGTRIIEIDVRKWSDVDIPNLDEVLIKEGNGYEFVKFYNFKLNYSDCNCEKCETFENYKYDLYYSIVEKVGCRYVVPCYYCKGCDDDESKDMMRKHIIWKKCSFLNFDLSKKKNLESYVEEVFDKLKERGLV